MGRSEQTDLAILDRALLKLLQRTRPRTLHGPSDLISYTQPEARDTGSATARSASEATGISTPGTATADGAPQLQRYSPRAVNTYWSFGVGPDQRTVMAVADLTSSNGSRGEAAEDVDPRTPGQASTGTVTTVSGWIFTAITDPSQSKTEFAIHGVSDYPLARPLPVSSTSESNRGKAREEKAAKQALVSCLQEIVRSMGTSQPALGGAGTISFDVSNEASADADDAATKMKTKNLINGLGWKAGSGLGVYITDTGHLVFGRPVRDSTETSKSSREARTGSSTSAAVIPAGLVKDKDRPSGKKSMWKTIDWAGEQQLGKEEMWEMWDLGQLLDTSRSAPAG